MARNNNINFDDEQMVKVPSVDSTKEEIETPNRIRTSKDSAVSCLQNKKVIVRFISRPTSLVSNPKHTLYGGMAENATKSYTVPLLKSGALKNILTDNEKIYLEEVMGLEPNTLSIYKKENNFWVNGTQGGISEVILHKQDNYFDLSNPIDYIKYKILLANTQSIAPSMEHYIAQPKITYQFVIIQDGEEDKIASEETDLTMKSYETLGNLVSDVYTLRVVVETLTGKNTAKNVSASWLKAECGKQIKSNAKKFLQIATDEYLPNKVLIKKCVENGTILNRGGFYFIADGQTMMCEVNEEPTLNVAAKWLGLPKNQQLKFMLEEKSK